MTDAQIIQLRLFNQHISTPRFLKPSQIVSWMVAMQAQEYAMAKWAVGLRLKDAVDSDVEKAFNKGEILRTHVMRPTWHFVAPADIVWLLALTAPRVHALNAYMYRQTDLSEKLLKRAAETMALALEGGRFLQRSELQDALKRKRITANSVRLAYIIMYAELEAIICSGPRKGNQFTYALLKERAPSAKVISREDALAEFVQRYFAARGPATLKDFAYWSGLSLQDAKAGAESLPSKFARETINGKQYIWLPSAKAAGNLLYTSFLMPDYDEYGMSYQDRAILMGSSAGKPEVLYNRMLVIDGKIEGTWKRSFNKKEIVIDAVPFAPLSTAKNKKLAQSMQRFKQFLQ
ncbi:MAG: winged helix DNA-binding domain-containing protein [Agriterribacter sp.]